MNQPTHLAPVFRRAAEIITTNGHHQGDYVPDPFSRVLTTPKTARPMSTAAALWCAGSPNGSMSLSALGNEAVRFLAARLLVDGEGPWDESRTTDCELHVSAWEDAPGRMAAEVVRELLRAAEAVECGEHASVVALGLRTSDGTEWSLASVDAFGTPRYVLAGAMAGVPCFAFAEAAELVGRFGAVSAWGGAA